MNKRSQFLLTLLPLCLVACGAFTPDTPADAGVPLATAVSASAQDAGGSSAEDAALPEPDAHAEDAALPEPDAHAEDIPEVSCEDLQHAYVDAFQAEDADVQAQALLDNSCDFPVWWLDELSLDENDIRQGPRNIVDLAYAQAWQAWNFENYLDGWPEGGAEALLATRPTYFTDHYLSDDTVTWYAPTYEQADQYWVRQTTTNDIRQAKDFANFSEDGLYVNVEFVFPENAVEGRRYLISTGQLDPEAEVANFGNFYQRYVMQYDIHDGRWKVFSADGGGVN